MKRRDHATVEAARRELVAHDYTLLHQPPADPVGRWQHVKKLGRGPELAIECERRARSVVWHIVDAPPRSVQAA